MTSLVAKGNFLVAAPALADPNFARAVVLICDHSEEGAMGLIVNRPLPAQLSDILSDEFTLPQGMPPAHQGGPVQGEHLLFLHSLAQDGLDAHPVCEGVFLGGDPEILKRVLASAKAPPLLRCYLGYAGWGAGQLEAEIAEGAWVVKPARARDVFTAEAATLRQRLLGIQGSDPYAPPKGPDLN